MKLIIDIDEKIYKESKKECKENDSLIIDTFTYAIGNGIPLEEELEQIKAKIDFEENWLKNIKMENGFISIADIEVAMSGIRSVIAELKGENNGETTK